MTDGALPSARRVVVVGCGGSGKSTLARQLAERTGLPLTHLDAVFYDQRWQPLPADQFAAIQQQKVAEPAWIIEGNYASTLPIRLTRADAVILLDLPATRCLWGIARRRWRYRGGQHRHDGVFDRITWSFVRYIIGYRHRMRPRVLRLIADHAPTAEVVVLTSHRQARQLVSAATHWPRDTS